MNRRMLASLSLLALCLMQPQVRGDLLLPGRRPIPRGAPAVRPQPAGRPLPTKIRLIVKVDEKAKLPVLRVPINLAMGQQPAEVPPPLGPGASRLGLPTVVAGVALTLAFATGGLWLVRRGSGRTLAVLGVLSLFAAGTAAVWADIGPRPPRPRPIPPPEPVKPVLTDLKLPALVELSDKLILEPVGPADHLTLIVPRSMVPEKGEKGKDRDDLPPVRRPD